MVQNSSAKQSVVLRAASIDVLVERQCRGRQGVTKRIAAGRMHAEPTWHEDRVYLPKKGLYGNADKAAAILVSSVLVSLAGVPMDTYTAGWSRDSPESISMMAANFAGRSFAIAASIGPIIC